MTVEARGPGGTVRHGYQEAAVLGPWTLVPLAPGRYRVEAAVVRAHWHWRAQDPLAVTLVIGDRAWTWGAVAAAAVTWGDGTLTAALDGFPAIAAA